MVRGLLQIEISVIVTLSRGGEGGPGGSQVIYLHHILFELFGSPIASFICLNVCESDLEQF